MTNFKLGLVSALAVTLAMSTGTAFADDLLIGVAGPVTGSNAASGDQLVKGANQAIADVNAKGGLKIGDKTYTLKSVVVDDACDPKQAVAVANQLANQKVFGVVGHFCSSSSIPASSIYNDSQIIQITPASTNPKLTEQKFPGLFRTCGRDDQQGTIAAAFIEKHFKGKKIAVIHDKQTYSQGLADATVAGLAKFHVKPTIYDTINPGEKDYSALITKLKQAGISVLYYGGYYAEAGLIVRQAADQGLKIAFFTGDGSVTQEFWGITGASGEGAYMTFGPDPLTNPDSKAIVDEFKKTNYSPEGYTLYAYAAVQVMVDGLKKAKSTDFDKVSAAIHAGNFKTVVGDLAYDAKGDVKGRTFIVYQWHNGNYTAVPGQ